MSPLGDSRVMFNEKYFIAEVWGWSPGEVRDMPISERKAFIRRKVDARQKELVDSLDLAAQEGVQAQARTPPPTQRELKEQEMKKQQQQQQRQPQPQRRPGPGPGKPPNRGVR